LLGIIGIMTIDAERVYELLRHIPAGKLTTYKLLSHALGIKAYRAIGQILKKNPYAPKVPCHRVIRSDGTIGGYFGRSTPLMVNRKKNLLRQEGIKISGNKVMHFRQMLYDLKLARIDKHGNKKINGSAIGRKKKRE